MRLVPLAVVVALAIAGCGSDSGDEDDAPVGTPAPNPEAQVLESITEEAEESGALRKAPARYSGELAYPWEASYSLCFRHTLKEMADSYSVERTPDAVATAVAEGYDTAAKRKAAKAGCLTGLKAQPES